MLLGISPELIFEGNGKEWVYRGLKPGKAGPPGIPF